jgi:hypothetical protein
MKPQHFIHLDKTAFPGANVVCTGVQVAAVIKHIVEVEPGLLWYMADLETIGRQFPPGRTPIPQLIGDAASLLDAVTGVEQFTSGVFVGVPRDLAPPSFRAGGLWTEDKDDADLGDAVLEIRAFDTSYVSVATADRALAQHVIHAFARR